MGRLIYRTKSVCPCCLAEIGAEVTAHEGGVYMEKRCPEHGGFSTLIWADSAEDYLDWLRCGGMDAETEGPADGGRGFGCAACSRPVSAALMTTNRCDLDCPVCFTRLRGEALHEPGLDECEVLLRRCMEAEGGDLLLELCGGEPTVRRDICGLARTARELGFSYIQLNTNGLRLAGDAGLCKDLRESGVTTVYLGFDGLSEGPYMSKYGRPMLESKLRAVENCAGAGLAVVLVTCLMPGVNEGELGGILRYAAEHTPAVKGLYIQPLSYFGTYPAGTARHITPPEVMRALAGQHEDVSEADFSPGSYEHAQCSFNAAYAVDAQGRLRPLTKRRPRGVSSVEAVRRSASAAWLPGRARTLTVGGMAFQDAWNIDLLRVRRCSIQIIQGDGLLVPLCSKYLSGCAGQRLLPGIG